MTADAGRTVGLYWGAPLTLSAGVREKGIKANGDPIDITNDDSAGWRTLIDKAGVNSIDISVSGVLVDTKLKADWFAGASASGRRMQALELRYPDNSKVAGTFYLQSYNDTGKVDDAITFEATFASSGVVVFTPA